MKALERDFFKRYRSSEEWLIRENVWDPRFQGVHESLFTLGNGYLGSRGALEEIPYDAYPGTYLAGVYDTSAAQVSEVVNLPNPVVFRIIAEGEKVGMAAMDVLDHRRALDMKKGLLWRHTTFSNSRKEKLDYQSIRFFSMDDPHLGAMQVCFTPLDNDIEVLVQNEVNTDVTNKGILTEGRKRHIRIVKVARKKSINYLCVKTLESKVFVAYADYLKIAHDKKTFATPHRVFRLRLKKGKTACFTCIYTVLTSREAVQGKLSTQSTRKLRSAIKTGFDKLIVNHIKAWDRKWRLSDCVITPGKELNKALRFNIYHLLISGNEHSSDTSIGAKTLSGEGYRGHVFWDTEIYITPFFIYTNPKIARNMLYYRHRRLNAARKIARDSGYKGALFPWESARKGADVTPAWHKNLDGGIIKIYTGKLEHHIAADVAYATYHYFLATGDDAFMVNAGLEMMFETARFWASRVVYNKKKKYYEIKKVIGPDEFHESVDNNVYTNGMARFNLLKASSLYKEYKESRPAALQRLARKISLMKEEVEDWRGIAAKILIPVSAGKGVLEGFSGYFQKRDARITGFDNNFMPMLPKDIAVRDLHKTQFVKQADVVMLLYLLPEEFTLDEKKKNFTYYEKRTLHKSSLSAAIHAAMACEAGEPEKAHRYFLHSLYGDLKDLYGNVIDGVHAASLGGAWQALVNGFCGMRLINGVLSFDPHLPPFLKKVRFKALYRGFELLVLAGKQKIEILPRSKGKEGKLHLSVYGMPQYLRGNKRYVFKR